jgi:prealbumin domain-containing protein
MRRATIAVLTATALMLTGLTLWPQRATALGETSVTLSCTDGTSIQLVLDAEALAGLTAAVQGMIDYPAGLGCTIVQNPLTTVFRHVALAATTKTFVVAGGRWLVECTAIFDNGEATTTLTVVKHVVNDFPENTAVASDFQMTVTGTAVPGSGAVNSVTFNGSEDGTLVQMRPGEYTVSETGPDGYASFFSPPEDCPSGVLGPGDNKTCTVENNDFDQGLVSPTQMIASPAGARYAALVTSSSPCDTAACVWVNIAVNLHYRDGTRVLEGTVNETIPEHQSCPNPNDPTTSIAVGPSHFTSKPNPGCLDVDPTAHRAAVITSVTHVSGLETFPGSGISRGFNVKVGDAINSSYLDQMNSPSQKTPDQDRDMLNAPPAADDSSCPGPNRGTQTNVLQNGNINVHPR